MLSKICNMLRAGRNLRTYIFTSFFRSSSLLRQIYNYLEENTNSMIPLFKRRTLLKKKNQHPETIATLISAKLYPYSAHVILRLFSMLYTLYLAKKGCFMYSRRIKKIKKFCVAKNFIFTAESSAWTGRSIIFSNEIYSNAS